MESKTYVNSVKAAYTTTADSTIDAFQWHSLEGFNVMLTGSANNEVRAAMAISWEDWDALVATVSALRCN